MIERDNAILKEVFGRVFQVVSGGIDDSFFGETQLKLDAEDAFFDPVDGLPTTVLKLTIDPKNPDDGNGAMHTGALCTIVDHLSTFTVFTDPSWWITEDGTAENTHINKDLLKRLDLEFGLSRNIQMHLQRPVPLGTTVYFVTKMLENTPVSTYFFSRIFDASGRLLVTGHHDKVKLTKTVKAKI